MEKKKKRVWTKDEEIKLLDMYIKQCPLKEIAKELNRSEGAIMARKKKINNRYSKWRWG